MKVFGVGLSRTGTLSLHAALQVLGYKSVHFPRTFQEIDQHDASMDTTVSAGYAFLDIMYPESKFILTVRDAGEWFESMQRSFGDVWHPSQSAEAKAGHWLLHGVPARLENREQLCWIFNEHNRRTESYFSSQAHRFLKLNICAGDGWEKLCAFLGKEIPDSPFPSERNRRVVTGK